MKGVDEHFMNMALSTAQVGRGQTHPNPVVGAVVVQDGQIVGLGAHLRAGTPHAEVHALAMAGKQAEGATIYVTLEPCNHHGRTPPCTELIVNSGIKRVVIASVDPNPKVDTKGIQRLRDAGLEVVTGILEHAANLLNESFFTWVTKGRPFVTLKLATTLDGYIAATTGHSQYVTGPEAHEDVQRLRSEHDAIGVGIGTVLADDPLLTWRIGGVPIHGNRQPVRVIFDTQGRTPRDAKLLVQPGPSVLLIGTRATLPEEILQNPSIRVRRVELEGNHLNLAQALAMLGQEDCTSLLLEGGGRLASAFLDARLVDKVVLYQSPRFLGGGVLGLGGRSVRTMNEAISLKDISRQSFGDDVGITGYPKYGEEESEDVYRSR